MAKTTRAAGAKKADAPAEEFAAPKTDAAPRAAAAEAFKPLIVTRRANREQPTSRALAEFEKIPDGGTVTVGCKLPNGLLLRVFEFVEREVPSGVPGLTATATIPEAVGESVRLHGYAVPFGKAPRYQIIGDFALTENVDAQFFRQWFSQNITSDVVKNGLVFCHAKKASAMEIAVERRDLRVGLEPMMVDKDPRVPRTGNKNVSDVETEEDMRKRISAAAEGE